MKKWLIVFLVTALFSRQVFAEGKFSFGLDSLIGTIILFPQGYDLGGAQWQPYFRPPPEKFAATQWDHKGPVYGYTELAVNYDNELPTGKIHTELAFRGILRGQTSTSSYDLYEGGASVKWLGSYETDLYKITMGLKSDDFSFTDFEANGDNITYLYGYYLFWDKQIKFDIAYKGYDATFTDLFLGLTTRGDKRFLVDERSNYSEDLPLASNVVATWNLDMPNYTRILPWWGNFAGRDGMRFTYMPDYLDGFIFRVAWRDLFTFRKVDLWWIDDQSTYEHNIKEYIKTFTLFSRFDMKPQFNIPLVLSLGYANRAAKAFHLGGSYNINDKINVAGDMIYSGLIDVKKYGILAFGASAGYSSAPLYANMYFRFGLDTTDTDYKNNGNFQIEPIVKYAIISNTLLAKFGLTYTTGVGEHYKKRYGIHINPGIYWNIKANADTEEPSSGIRFFYRFGTTWNYGSPVDKSNDLIITFHWSI